MHVVFVNDNLKSKDSKLITNACPNEVSSKRIEMHIGLDFVAKRNDFIVLDEGDVQIYQATKAFISLMATGANVIGLTATCSSERVMSLEIPILQELNTPKPQNP